MSLLLLKLSLINCCVTSLSSQYFLDYQELMVPSHKVCYVRRWEVSKAFKLLNETEVLPKNWFIDKSDKNVSTYQKYIFDQYCNSWTPKLVHCENPYLNSIIWLRKQLLVKKDPGWDLVIGMVKSLLSNSSNMQ